MHDAGPRFPPLPSVLSTEDPDAHREERALEELREEDAAMVPAEFAAVPRVDDQWDFMERMEDRGLYDLEGRVY